VPQQAPAAARLVVFDLDGTISRHDTLLAYLIGFFRRNRARWPRMLLWIPAVLRFLASGDRGALKSALMRATLGGASRSDIDAWTDCFVTGFLAHGAFADALRAVSHHRKEGDLLVLMSASPDLYVPEIGARLGFAESICTGTQWQGERFDGALTTPNRQGPEKALCFAALQRRHPRMRSIAYGNSAHDFEHMQLADEAWLVNASPALLRASHGKHFHLANWR